MPSYSREGEVCFSPKKDRVMAMIIFLFSLLKSCHPILLNGQGA